jgi:hypothetical protein
MEVCLYCARAPRVKFGEILSKSAAQEIERRLLLCCRSVSFGKARIVDAERMRDAVIIDGFRRGRLKQV